MVNGITDKTLQSIANQIHELSQKLGEQKEQPIKKEVVLFFSFDVVNSTAYKTINYYGWAQVLNLLFKGLREEVQNQIKGAEMWRVLGDEAIFVVKIRDEEELREYINKVFKIMVSTIFKLKKGNYFEQDSNFKLMKLQNILSLKAAAWIAAVNNIGDINDKKIHLEDIDNIFERYHSQEGYEIFEFLGNDIDTGFRIATQTQDGRMVISYELAYLVSQQTQSLSYLHIITYKRLKGVWKNKLYPIIWYHDPFAYEKEISFQESFSFDACAESELIKEYHDNRESEGSTNEIRDKKMYTEPFYALNKILVDRELTEKIKQLQQLIKEAIHDQTKYIDMEKMQIHCVAVCFKIDTDKIIRILIAKRQGKREKFRDMWEFGCAKAVINKSIAERIVEEYKQDFQVDIRPILDDSREMKEPIPIALYRIDHNSSLKNDKKDKGIITLAEIVGDYSPDMFSPTQKHEEVRWITESDMVNIEAELVNTIPDFKRTLEQSFKKIKEIKGL